jgi:hypothetical protein
MFEKIFVQYWMTLPKDIRQHLAFVFNIPRTGITEIRDDVVLTDGHTNADLDCINADMLAAYTGEKPTEYFPRLWEIAIKRARKDLDAPTEDTVLAPVEEPPYCNFCTSTSGRHKKGCPKFR